MAIFTSAELAEQIAAWKAALLAVASAQSYTISGRMLTKADLPEIRSTLSWLEREQEKTSSTFGPHIVSGRVKR